jgi:MFS family permease
MAEQSPTESSFFRGNILAIALNSSIAALGGLVGSYTPLYFEKIGGNPLTLGLFGFAAVLVQFPILSIGGFIADYYGRRRVIVLAALYSAFFPVLYALVRDWWVFGALSVLAAFGALANPATHATIVDSILPERRTLGIAYLQVISTLPLVVSPLIGEWLILSFGLANGFRMGCMCAAVFAFLAAAPVLVLLKETLRSRTTKSSNFVLRDGFLGFIKPSTYKLPSGLKVLMVTYALVMFANGAVGSYYILYVKSVISESAAYNWGLIASLQVLLAVLLKIPGGWVSDRFGKRKIMIISLLATIPTILLFALTRSFIQVMFVALLLVAAGIYYAPAHEALQADLTPKGIRGRINALWLMSSTVSNGVGVLIGGFTFYTLGPAVPFYVFAIAELGAMLLLIGMVKDPETREF